jgi:hypothetical protein
MTRPLLALAGCGLALLLAPLLPPAAHSGQKKPEKIDAKAMDALRAMGKLLAGLKQFAVDVEETTEDTLDETGQKIQLTNHLKALVARPEGVRATIRGDTSDVEFVYDGKGAILFDRARNAYVTFPIKGSIDTMMDELHERFGVTMPVAELLLSKPDAALLEKVETGRYVGLHQVGGAKCHHLAFTQRLIDWQIWIEAGEKAWPRKLVITYHRQAGQPQYVAVLRRWDGSPKVGEDTFRFTPPADAKKVEAFRPPEEKKKK